MRNAGIRKRFIPNNDVRGSLRTRSETWPFKPDRLFYGLHLHGCIVSPPSLLFLSLSLIPFSLSLSRSQKSFLHTHTLERLLVHSGEFARSIHVCIRERDIPYRTAQKLSLSREREREKGREREREREESFQSSRASLPDCHFDPDWNSPSGSQPEKS